MNTEQPNYYPCGGIEHNLFPYSKKISMYISHDIGTFPRLVALINIINERQFNINTPTALRRIKYGVSKIPPKAKRVKIANKVFNITLVELFRDNSIEQIYKLLHISSYKSAYTKQELLCFLEDKVKTYCYGMSCEPYGEKDPEEDIWEEYQQEFEEYECEKLITKTMLFLE